jgi:hypothetical protein
MMVNPDPDRLLLQGDYVLSLRAFLALSYSELNALAFSQSLEARRLDGAVVNEYVRTTAALNETKTFGLVKKLYFTSYCI